MDKNIHVVDISLNNINDGVNDWTSENYNTVKSWQDDIKKCIFIYQAHLDKINKYLKISLIIILIVSSLVVLIGGLNVLLGVLDIKWVLFSLNVISLVGSVIVTIMTGLIKLNNWQESILVLSKYLQSLELTWFNIEIELRINSDQRQNAKDFIKRLDGEYLFLMRSQPPLKTSEFNMYEQKYKNDHLTFN